MVYSSTKNRIKQKKMLRWLAKADLYIITVCLIVATIISIVKDVEATNLAAVETVEQTSESIEIIVEKIERVTPNKEDVEMLAKLVWGEARGVDSKAQQAAVIWCALNRVDSKKFPNTIEEVVTQPYQFAGYNESYPATDEFMEMAEDVLVRWYQEKAGTDSTGRTLPKEYLFFIGDGERNHFSKEWKSKDYYDWSLPSPYEN